MNEKIWVALFLMIGMIFVGMGIGSRPVSAYGESSGPWTAGEKAQVIKLLQQIESNTR